MAKDNLMEGHEPIFCTICLKHSTDPCYKHHSGQGLGCKQNIEKDFYEHPELDRHLESVRENSDYLKQASRTTDAFIFNSLRQSALAIADDLEELERIYGVLDTAENESAIDAIHRLKNMNEAKDKEIQRLYSEIQKISLNHQIENSGLRTQVGILKAALKAIALDAEKAIDCVLHAVKEEVDSKIEG